ncbi:sulfite exporter TauE/SafE family protein [Bacillus marasmi]|uniref:urease accessory protein UreH domain-containing protein n=1 Tax=Bacillus marasmi TaxID=1926279 RepID=UPI0011CC7EEE|nr:sulfite exporter TauE/SafE family protein [Bacillus marasmi]
MSMRREKINVYDMTCTSCEKRVERSINKLPGIKKVKANFSGQFAELEYDDKVVSVSEIKDAIQKAGYTTDGRKDYKFIGILVVVAAIALLGMNTSGFDMDAKLTNASYAVLFMVGVLTSIHCVGMCGGIMLSQSLNKATKTSKFEAMKPAIFYNMGRVVSYTILGGIIGAIGSVFSLSLSAQAGLQIFAGVFMIMMGFNMAGFSWFRKFQIKLPAAVCKMQARPKAPFMVGFFNGLMPCGPLQTMQIFALGTGSAVAGALSMFMFSLGTVPLMLAFGAVTGLLSKGYTKQLLKFGGILIIVLGIIMGNRGLALAGMNMSPMSLVEKIGGFGTENVASANAVKATIKDGVQYVNMTASYSGYNPNTIYVQKDLPVKWVVDGKELSGCNNAIVIPDLNIQQKLQSGLNTIEFTPEDKDLAFSCWMGMIRGTIKVVDNLEKVSASESTASSDDASTGTSNGGATTETNPSIYGDDLSKVPTERLVKKAELVGAGNEQTVLVKGIGFEFEPLIIVSQTGVLTKFSFDLTEFDKPDSEFMFVDMENKQIIQKFTGQSGVVNVEFTSESSRTYGIYKDEQLLGVFETVEDLNSEDPEEMRSKYLG